MGQSVLDLYRNHESILLDARRALAGENFVTIADLGDLIFETSYKPIFDSNGKLSGTVGVSIDITERIAAERKAASVIAELSAEVEL